MVNCEFTGSVATVELADGVSGMLPEPSHSWDQPVAVNSQLAIRNSLTSLLSA
jgi:hypothetical protein